MLPIYHLPARAIHSKYFFDGHYFEGIVREIGFCYLDHLYFPRLIQEAGSRF